MLMGLGASNRNDYFPMELQSTGGQAWFINLTGPSSDELQVGDRWEFHIVNGPKNSPVLEVFEDASQKQIGTTDSSGNFTMSGTATSDQVGTHVRHLIDMQFPNSVGSFTGYQDPTAPTGYRNVAIAIISFDVVPKSSVAPGPMMPNGPIGQTMLDLARPANAPVYSITSTPAPSPTPPTTLVRTIQPTTQQLATPTASAQPTVLQLAQSTTPTITTTPTSSSPSTLSFLTNKSIDGIPNWALLAAAAGILFFMMRGR